MLRIFEPGRMIGNAILICAFWLSSARCAPSFEAPKDTGPSRASAAALASEPKRRITTEDAIRMTRLANSSYEAGLSSKGIAATFSPNGRQFVVVLRKGNLEQNTNEYSLVLFDTSDLFHSREPRILTTLASSSNRPAISEPRWLNDNNTILFLGEAPGELTQLYSVECESGRLRRITSHPTNLTSFATSLTGERVVYVAETPASSVRTPIALRNGIHVTHELLSDLVSGTLGAESPAHELFVTTPKAGQEMRIEAKGNVPASSSVLSLSPDGKYFVAQLEARQIPSVWATYEDQTLQALTHHATTSAKRTGIYQYELFNVSTGESYTLLEAPIRPFGLSEAAWSPDSRSLVISDTYLPLNIESSAERRVRASHYFMVQIKIPSRDVVKISDKDLRLIRWDQETNLLECEVGMIDSLIGKPVPAIHFKNEGSTWKEVTAPRKKVSQSPDIVLAENSNEPPRLLAVSSETGQSSLLMDLNPQFSALRFGNVESVGWTDTSGHDVKAGLYLPPDYVAGKKYPLVIQTHGFRDDKFWIDGPWTTAFAAQPLASKGFVVLQVADQTFDSWDTKEEAPRAMAAYEGGIKYLDARGILDKNRLGIIGFSRTCYYVAYTLTHSTYHFAAAVMADGIDAGYFQYVVFSNTNPSLAGEFEAFNGASPYGTGLSLWMKNSPEFLIQGINTPVRIQAIGSASLLSEWPWFSGLSRLNKPVDMIYLPDGSHILQKPWERMVSQQGDVDWFCFWLKDEVDPDPEKGAQYARWREERQLQEK